VIPGTGIYARSQGLWRGIDVLIGVERGVPRKPEAGVEEILAVSSWIVAKKLVGEDESAASDRSHALGRERVPPGNPRSSSQRASSPSSCTTSNWMF
jgi:hypothetical protein